MLIFQSQAGIPWLFVMGLLLVVDLVAFSLTMTDFHYEEMASGKFSCPLQDWPTTRRSLTISSLALVFSRGGILWLCNLFLFISVLRLSLLTVSILLVFSTIIQTGDIIILETLF